MRIPSPKGSSALILASVATGVFGAVNVFGARAALGLESFAPLAQIWTLWALLGASVTFGTQHRVAQAALLGTTPASLKRELFLITSLTMLGMIGVAYRNIDAWFGGETVYVGIAVATVAGSVANGVARGRAAGSGDHRRLALLLLGENAIRVALLIPLAIVGAGAVWFGLSILAGFTINVVSRPARQVASAPTEGSAFSPSGLVAATAVGFVNYATVSAGPLLLATGGVSPSGVSAYFLVVAIARVPFIAVLGLVPGLSVHAGSLAAGHAYAELDRLNRRFVAAGGGAAVAVGVVAALVSNATFGALLGTDSEFGGSVYAGLGAAAMLSLAALAVSVVLLSANRVRAVLLVWALPVAGSVVGMATGWLATPERLAWATTAAFIVVITALSVTRVGVRSSQ